MNNNKMSKKVTKQIKNIKVISSNKQEKYNMKSKISQINLIILSFFILTFSACDSKSDELIKVFKEKPESELDIALNQKNDKKSYSKDDNISYTRRNAITTAVENVSPSIVGINVTEVRQVVYRDPFSSFFDDPMISRFFNRRSQSRTQKYEVKGLGSGFIISPDGYILTNHHVAGDASKIVISMTDGKKYDAKIIGTDLTSDVALLKIESDDDLPYIPLGNSDNVMVGEWSIAFGNPFGLFDNNAKPTVTVGVISNTGVNFMHDDNNGKRVYKNMLQTDAAISSGNSGGPLVNSDGEVIGMNTVIFSTANSNQGSGSIGIGFSIPINRVKNIVQKIKNSSTIDRNFFVGMDVRDIDENIVNVFRLGKTSGAIVVEINRNSPAEKAGIEPGDIILEINGQKVNKLDDFNINIYDMSVGDEVELKILRDDKEINKTMELTAYPKNRR